ncbi:MAG: hypothetical protein EXX96DRAFT_560107 [Benjaminiella poitrasii]|nr:MAG: hypothetical protein EXX96DRAFT_560107 [Benjaminiella poitrasii]
MQTNTVNKKISSNLEYYHSSLPICTEDPWSTLNHLEFNPDYAQRSTFELTIDNVLEDIDVPSIYHELYHKVVSTSQESSIQIDLLFSLSDGLSPSNQHKIKEIIETTEITLNAFNVCVALIACVQNNLDVSLESVYEHKNDLPIPIISTRTDNSKDTEDDMVSTTTTVILPTTMVNNEERTEAQKTMNHWLLLDMDHITISHLDTSPTNSFFFFKHVRYEIESEKLRTRVYRRYSDFWWLGEMLLCRYPFRLIPHLPPKKIGGRNAVFEEKRRKGLSKFINAVVRHPVLGKDEIVFIFLSYPSDFQGWKRGKPPSLDEEFVRKTHDISYLERLIPMDLEDRINRMKKRISVTLQYYERMYLVMNEIVKLKKELGTDYVRYSVTLNELDKECWIMDCQGCSKMKQSYESIIKSMHQAGVILNRQASNTGDSIIENLKQQRDLLESFRDLLERREKDTNSIQNEQILARQMARYKQGKVEPALAHDEEQQQQEERYGSIVFDKTTGGLSLVQQREVFIKYCFWNELSYFHKHQAYVSAMYKQYVKDEVRHARQWNEHWKQLETVASEMPTEPLDFL